MGKGSKISHSLQTIPYCLHKALKLIGRGNLLAIKASDKSYVQKYWNECKLASLYLRVLNFNGLMIVYGRLNCNTACLFMRYILSFIARKLKHERTRITWRKFNKNFFQIVSCTTNLPCIRIWLHPIDRWHSVDSGEFSIRSSHGSRLSPRKSNQKWNPSKDRCTLWNVNEYDWKVNGRLRYTQIDLFSVFWLKPLKCWKFLA